MKDLSGHKFGDILVIGKSKERHPSTGEVLWKTKCRCGNSSLIRTSKLPQRKSCGSCSTEERTNTFEDEARRISKTKGRRRFSDLSLGDQLLAINDYIFGMNIKELSGKWNTDPMSTRNGIVSFRERLNTMHELHYMERAKKTSLDTAVIDRALSTSLVSDAIASLVSKDTSEELTLQEELYCYLFVYTGSNEIAVQESGFLECLPKATPPAKQLLGMFLREKPNLKEYIQLLRDARIEDVKASKQIVQHELINQVEQLKEAVSRAGKSTDRGHLLRAIELLGKTVGAFEDRVRVTEVNASDALDELLEMAKRESTEIKELPAGSYVDEHYEVAHG